MRYYGITIRDEWWFRSNNAYQDYTQIICLWNNAFEGLVERNLTCFIEVAFHFSATKAIAARTTTTENLSMTIESTENYCWKSIQHNWWSNRRIGGKNLTQANNETISSPQKCVSWFRFFSLDFQSHWCSTWFVICELMAQFDNGRKRCVFSCVCLWNNRRRWSGQMGYATWRNSQWIILCTAAEFSISEWIERINVNIGTTKYQCKWKSLNRLR